MFRVTLIGFPRGFRKERTLSHITLGVNDLAAVPGFARAANIEALLFSAR